MKIKRRNLLTITWRLFRGASTAWNKIAVDKLTVSDLRLRYVLPWVVLCVLVNTVFACLYINGHTFEVAILNAITELLAIGGGYVLSRTICVWYGQRLHPGRHTAFQLEKVLAFSFTLVFIIRMVTTMLPGLFYLRILNIYTAYLVWEGARAVLKLEEDERGNIVFVYTLCILLVPFLIGKVMALILPNMYLL